MLHVFVICQFSRFVASATKWGQERKPPLAVILSSLKFFELLFILLYLVCVCAP